MNFERADRLPRWEWATWWDKTIERWRGEGLPEDLNTFEISQYFGLDPYVQFWFRAEHDGKVSSLDDYRGISPQLSPAQKNLIESMRPWAKKQENGEAVVWATVDGFFWYPRTLMGIEPHLVALVEQPELIRAINRDLAEHHVNLVREMAKVCIPAFMTIAEDMSFNHGPMLSKRMFDDLLLPYYHRLIPVLKELGTIPIVDTDGDLTEMVPWLEEAGIEGVLPLERNAGVDALALREKHPRLKIIGHYDKLVMDKGEAAMRGEFERLLPLMKKGGFIPSVDHQTPPGVSLDQYREYLRLLEEYTEM